MVRPLFLFAPCPLIRGPLDMQELLEVHRENGAPAMAGLGALRIGAGLATVATPQSISHFGVKASGGDD